MATRPLQVVISGDASNLNRAFRGVENNAKRTEGRMQSFGKNLAKGFAVAGAAAGGAAAVGIKKAAEAAIEAEKSQARLQAQLRASGISFAQHREQIDRVIQSHSNLSGLDDEDLQDSFTNIVRTTGDVNEALRLNALAADIARARNLDVAKAGQLVARMAGGNTTALNRYGVTIKEGATVQEALAAAQRKFAGQAEAYGKTTAGSLDRASVASENLGEVVGTHFTPVLARAATGLVNLVDKAGQLGGPIRQVSGVVGDAAQNMIASIRRFAARNREDIDAVIRAMRNLAQFIRNVVTDVILPVIRRLLPIFRGVFEGIVQVLRGVVRIITGIINGDWSRVWDGFKDIVRGAARAFGAVIGGLAGIVRDAIAAAGRAALNLGKSVASGIVRGIGNIGKAIYDKIKGGVDWAVGKLKDVAGSLNPFGDGLGAAIGDGLGNMMPQVGPFGGSLLGARPAMAPFAAMGAQFGLHVSSGRRPGAVTNSGNQSWHSTGEAIDVSGPATGMLRYFRMLRQTMGARLAELIYTPGGVGIWNGQPHTYTGRTAADHYDHVHVAFDSGRPGQGDGLGRRRGRAGVRMGDGQGRLSSQQQVIEATARKYGINPAILWGLYGAESNFGRNLGPSPAGALGPFQFMPATAQSYGINPMNFAQAAYAAAKYLGTYKSRGVAGMLAAYNAGPAGNPNNPETRAYIPKVQQLARTWPGSSSTSGGGVTGGGSSVARTPVTLGTRVSGQRAGGLRGRAARLPNLRRAFQPTGRRRPRNTRQAIGTRLGAFQPSFRQGPTNVTPPRGSLGGAFMPSFVRGRGRGRAGTISGGGGGGGEAGIAEDTGFVETPDLPTWDDFYELAVANARMSGDPGAHIAAQQNYVQFARDELHRAQQTADPRDDLQAIQRLESQIQALNALTEALDTEREDRERQRAAQESLAAELKALRERGGIVTDVERRTALKYFSDLIGGNIVGRGVHPRMMTAGTGVGAITP